MNQLTSFDMWVFSPSAVWLYRLPIQHRPGINTQSATGILNQEFMHWFYEFQPLTRRQQALTGLQTSRLPPTVSIRQSPPALTTELHSPGLHFQLWVLYLPLDVLSLTWVHQEISSWPRLWESFAPEVKLCVIIYRLDYTVVVID